MASRQPPTDHVPSTSGASLPRRTFLEGAVGLSLALFTSEPAAGADHPPATSIEPGDRHRIARPSVSDPGIPRLVAQLGHSETLSSVLFSPDGKHILTASEDGTARLWEIGTGKEVQRFEGHFSILSAEISPDGKYVLTAIDDKTACLWDIVTGKEVQRFVGHSENLFSAIFSPDGKSVLTGSADGTVRLWQSSTGKEIQRFKAHPNSQSLAIFSPNGKYILTASGDKAVGLWDAATGKERRGFVGHSGRITSAIFSPDSRYILTASEDKSARLWEVGTGKEIQRFTGRLPMLSAEITPDGKSVLTASEDGIARLWNVATGKEVRRFEENASTLFWATLSPDGSTVLTANGDTAVRLWNTATGKEVRRFDRGSGFVRSAVFSSDSRYLLVGGYNTASLWEVATGKEIHQLAGQADFLSSAIFSPNGKYVLTEGKDRATCLWDIASGRKIQRFAGYFRELSKDVFSPDSQHLLTANEDNTLRLTELLTSKEIQRFVGHSAGITSAIFSPDGGYVLTVSKDLSARLWEVGTGKEIRRMEGGSHRIYAAIFSPNGKYVLTTEKILDDTRKDRVNRLWDIETGKILRQFATQASLLSVIFSPDSSQILITIDNKNVRLWDAVTGKEIQRFEGVAGFVESTAFSSDGTRVLIATGSYDDNRYTASLWEVATGKEIQRFEGHTHRINTAVFSTDGKYVLTASRDNTTRLWDAVTGIEVRRFIGHAGMVYSAVFSPDGKHVLTASWDATARLWDVATGKELGSLLSFTDGTWAVTDPEGRFDGSNEGGVTWLYWVLGLEPIELSQLKSFYYEPGLLARLFAGRPAPFPVPDFTSSSIRLWPLATIEPLKPGEKVLTVKLVNRGGGIGRVRVWVDDALLMDDARPAGFNVRMSHATLNISLDKVAALKPGQKRTIRVVVENAIGDILIQSRGVEGAYLPPQDNASTALPEFYAIVLGVSDYAEPSLHLRYAAKDATDFADALALGAKKLYGPERVHITLLTSDAKDTSGTPTRANIVAAFERVRKQAKTTDVLVVYGAGHGVALRQPERRDDLYCYLTQDAHTNIPQDLQNKALRQVCAITSEDLVTWLNPATGIKANKKVILLDTCAAGAAQQVLTAAVRELTPEEVARARAIDQLKERTAFHILMGCAADRVSYEAGEYGQGLLTYALLEGMKNTDRFIEVPGIFTYVEKRVPELAMGIGGIQKPQVASPLGSAVQIGEMGQGEREGVRLAVRKLRLLAPVFLNPEEIGDPLGLTERVELLLANESEATARARGGGGFVFIGKGKLPGAIETSSSYTVANGTATVRIALRRDSKKVAEFTVTAPAAPPEALAKTVAEAIQSACKKLTP